MIAVHVDRLTQRFGAFTAVDDVSFDVAPGEFVTLLGPSGCGKTTLLKLLSGFLTPSAGTIRLADVIVNDVPPEARDTAMCFQSYALFPHLTVAQNLEFGLTQNGTPRKERKERTLDVARKLDLEGQLAKLPNQLSGGQQQRVSLGRALVMRPGVILFDEPLSNLDAKLRDRVRLEIRSIQREYGLTAIYVTHDQSEALALSDRIIVMNGGRIEQIDTPERLYHHPRTRFVADFIGAANVIEGTVDGPGPNDTWRASTPMGPIDFVSTTRPEREVLLCWRPEHVAFGQGSLRGHVEARSFQGNYVDYVLTSATVEHRVQVASSEVRTGEDVTFTIDPQRVVQLEREP